MRILVLQLARLGDIYQTWPALRALRRQYPQAQIHLVVRERFAAATEGLSEVDHIHLLKTADILAPFILGMDQDDPEQMMSESLNQVHEFVQSLAQFKFDRVINLTFSNLSSYLTHALTTERTRVSGYTRHDDGSFCPADDIAAYFLAQAGVGGCNQIHLLEIFARAADVELAPEDFRLPTLTVSESVRERTRDFFESTNVLAVQPFASTSDKSLTSAQWLHVIEEILAHTNARILLLGAPCDQSAVAQIAEQLNSDRILDLSGQTELRDLFWLLRQCRGLLAPDSVTVHMASMTQTPTVNLSFATVNALETGPWVPGSRVVFAQTPEDMQSSRVVAGVVDVLRGLNTTWENSPADYRHQLVSAVYFATPFPMTTSVMNREAFRRVREIMILAMEQCAILMSNCHAREAMLILNQVDDLLGAVSALAPDLEPIFRWYQAEQMRVRPGSLNEIIVQTKKIYEQLMHLSDLGSQVPTTVRKGSRNVDSPMVEL